MPKFEVGAGFFADFDTIPIATASGETVAGEHLIRIKTIAGSGRPAGFENFIGDFNYDSGLPTGTIDKFRFVTDANQLVYVIKQANIDVVELRKTAELHDPQAFLKLIFRADDSLTGAALDDTMGGFAGHDLLKGKAGDDWLRGMAGSDALRGNAGNDRLDGGRGSDALNGGAGDDRLDGGRGTNLLTGSAGDDTFVFVTAGRPNWITDYAEGDLVALGLPGLGPTGPLDAALFHRGARAKTSEQRILYDEDTGWLLFARKGSATHHPDKFARVGNGLDHLDAGDFLVI